MKNKNLISLAIVLSYAIIILGIIHDVATYSPIIKNGLGCLSEGNLQAMLYMSLICGSSFIISGLVMILLLKKVADNPFLKTAILAISIFLGISGILAVIYMFGNPFAYLALLLNAGVMIVSIILVSKIKNT